MDATHRLGLEQVFYDRQAQERTATFAEHPERLQFCTDDYLKHETWIRLAFDRLGDLAGRRVLDFGCGHGMAAVVLARQGARVTGFDLSGGYLEEAGNRARANRVSIDFVQADGNCLPFADHSFDRIWGNAILHHLTLEQAASEIFRVLRPGGIAIFCEPWGENPLLNWARNCLPYPAKDRTPDEQPLRQQHVYLLKRIFPSVELCGCQLLSMAGRLLRRGRIVAGLDWCDDMLLRRIPALRQYCRYVVLTLKR